MSKVDSLARRPNRPKPSARLQTMLRRSRHYDIQTVYGLLKAFGGFEAVASDYTGGPAEDIERWAIGGSIPTGWGLRMFARACAMDLTVNPSVWGFAEDDDAANGLHQLVIDARRYREGGAHD
jgi:hypothetical protein